MQPNWKPLEEKIGKRRCAGFMFMGRVNGINLFKHGITRQWLCLDDNGNCHIRQGNGFKQADFEIELAKIETALGEAGETFETVYDETYIGRKYEALARAGVRVIRIQVEPENVTIN